MSSETSPIDFLCDQVVLLQRQLVALKDQEKIAKRKTNAATDELLLGIIDVIDLAQQLSSGDDNIYLRKVEKRLMNILKRHGVARCEFPDMKVVPDLGRVVETREVAGAPPGKIIEICRAGYVIGNRVLRPADLITVR